MSEFPKAPANVPHGEEFQEAIRFACEKHAKQFRKKPINGIWMPFVAHPLQVFHTLWAWGVCDRALGLAAICHDLVEDCDVSLFEIERKHGFDVASLVNDVTLIIPAGVSKNEELALKERFMESFRTKPIRSVLLKAADRISNVQDFALTDPDYAKRYFHKADPVWNALSDRRKEITDSHGNPRDVSVMRSVDSLRLMVACL